MWSAGGPVLLDWTVQALLAASEAVDLMRIWRHRTRVSSVRARFAGRSCAARCRALACAEAFQLFALFCPNNSIFVSTFSYQILMQKWCWIARYTGNSWKPFQGNGWAANKETREDKRKKWLLLPPD